MQFSPEQLGLTQVAYTVRETRQIVRCSNTSLYAYINTGKIRSTKAGRKRLFFAIDIADFLYKLRDGEKRNAKYYPHRRTGTRSCDIQARTETGFLNHPFHHRKRAQ